MKVAEFIEWLQLQPQDAIVHVLHQQKPDTYQSYGCCEEVEFTPCLSTLTDFNDNPFVKPDAPYFGKRYLLLGEPD